MMLDDAGFENEKVTGREPAPRRDKPAEPLYDREVPLNGTSGGHALLHDWLDGEIDAMRASEVEGKSKVELWTRINAESEMLRRRVTPVGVQQRIMASLPETPGAATNWWKQVTPVSAIAIAVALLAVGALIIQALR
jgi:hypothetical protein